LVVPRVLAALKAHRAPARAAHLQRSCLPSLQRTERSPPTQPCPHARSTSAVSEQQKVPNDDDDERPQGEGNVASQRPRTEEDVLFLECSRTFGRRVHSLPGWAPSVLCLPCLPPKAALGRVPWKGPKGPSETKTRLKRPQRPVSSLKPYLALLRALRAQGLGPFGPFK